MGLMTLKIEKEQEPPSFDNFVTLIWFDRETTHLPSSLIPFCHDLYLQFLIIITTILS